MSANQIEIEWKAIELDYRAGLKTLRVMADEYGLSHVAINKRAKRDGWTRDLSAKIRAKAEYLVTKSLVNKSVNKKDLVTENQMVDAAAETQSTIIITHRKDISRSRDIGTKLLLELEKQTEHPEQFVELGDLMLDATLNYDKINEAYRKVVGMPGRVDSYRKLVESLKTMISLERQAFGISDNSNGDANKSPERMSIDDILREREEIRSRLTCS
jgi:hypothetical protein